MTGKWVVISLIRLYQWTVGPMLGNCCRFHPTCSEYALQALQKHGFCKGLALSLRRLCKCRPGHPGGVDEVP